LERLLDAANDKINSLSIIISLHDDDRPRPAPKVETKIEVRYKEKIVREIVEVPVEVVVEKIIRPKPVARPAPVIVQKPKKEKKWVEETYLVMGPCPGQCTTACCCQEERCEVEAVHHCEEIKQFQASVAVYPAEPQYMVCTD